MLPALGCRKGGSTARGPEEVLRSACPMAAGRHSCSVTSWQLLRRRRGPCSAAGACGPPAPSSGHRVGHGVSLGAHTELPARPRHLLAHQAPCSCPLAGGAFPPQGAWAGAKWVCPRREEATLVRGACSQECQLHWAGPPRANGPLLVAGSRAALHSCVGCSPRALGVVPASAAAQGASSRLHKVSSASRVACQRGPAASPWRRPLRSPARKSHCS